MKKRLFSLALTLALCLGLAGPAFAADTSGLDANTRKAYYDVLTAQINKYGIVSANGKKGVEYAEIWRTEVDGKSYCFIVGPASSTGFSDVPPNAAYASAVAWAVENGVTAGTGDTTFSPGDTCTRGQIVTFLHRAMG